MTGYLKSTVNQSEFALNSCNTHKALENVNRQIGTGSGFRVVPGPNVSLIMALDSLSAKFARQAERMNFFWCTKDLNWSGFRTSNGDCRNKWCWSNKQASFLSLAFLATLNCYVSPPWRRWRNIQFQLTSRPLMQSQLFIISSSLSREQN